MIKNIADKILLFNFNFQCSREMCIRDSSLVALASRSARTSQWPVHNTSVSAVVITLFSLQFAPLTVYPLVMENRKHTTLFSFLRTNIITWEISIKLYNLMIKFHFYFVNASTLFDSTVNWCTCNWFKVTLPLSEAWQAPVAQNSAGYFFGWNAGRGKLRFLVMEVNSTRSHFSVEIMFNV